MFRSIILLRVFSGIELIVGKRRQGSCSLPLRCSRWWMAWTGFLSCPTSRRRWWRLGQSSLCLPTSGLSWSGTGLRSSSGASGTSRRSSSCLWIILEWTLSVEDTSSKARWSSTPRRTPISPRWWSTLTWSFLSRKCTVLLSPSEFLTAGI